MINNRIDGGRTSWAIEKNAQFWNDEGRKSIEDALKRRENTRIAKNVIMFLGDGMGVTTVTAGRIRKGQVNGQLGEDFLTEMEQFPHLGLAKTYVEYFPYDRFRLFSFHSATTSIIKRPIQLLQPQLISAVSKLNSAQSDSTVELNELTVRVHSAVMSQVFFNGVNN